MKRLILVGGPMGVGKTTACQLLKKSLPRCAFLDGDWCWDMHPLIVTDETCAMVMDNIAHLLSGFLACSELQYIIFCWVMHEKAILDSLLSRLPLDGCAVTSISLIAPPNVLSARLQRDVDAGLRTPDVIARSLVYLPRYDALDTVKLDTGAMDAQQTAREIARLAGLVLDSE
ncbi:MAG: AAA family ATPase [Clostridiales bacterium]|nr:AAA family ATPase [Clostridiales bacterium]